MNGKEDERSEFNEFLSIERQKIDYMLFRSLKILLSDFGKHDVEVVEKYIKLGTIYATNPVIFIKKVFLLHQYLLLTSYAINHIFPLLIRRLEVSSSKQFREERWIPRGRLVWERSIIIQAQKSREWLVYETPVKGFETPENLLAALSLYEIIIHSKSMYKYFSNFLTENTPELLKIKETARKAKKFLLQTPLRDFLNQIQTKDLIFEKDYEIFVEKGSDTAKSKYHIFCLKIEEDILKGRQNNYYYQRLIRWRRRYAKSVDDFILSKYMDIESTEFPNKWTKNRLYEIFVLLELVNAIAKRKKDFRIKQLSFLRPRKNALFALEKNEFPIAWIHYDKLVNIDSFQGFKMKMLGVWKFRPDITIINNIDFKNSVIIDMKNYEKFNPEAIKDMHAYRNSYVIECNGREEYLVKEAILCFSCDIPSEKWSSDQFYKHDDNIIEIPHIDFNLHSVTIIPSKESEATNEKAINYIIDILLRLTKLN